MQTQKEKKVSILTYKLLYTALILIVYIVGKSLPLYKIDLSAYLHRVMDAEALILQTISGDIYQCSLLALGISPYMLSSILIQVISACKSADSKARTSPAKTNRLTLRLALVIALIQAIVRVQSLHFQEVGVMLPWVKFVAVTEMVAGAMFIVWLSSRNKKYGVGGQSALIFVNLIEGISVTLQGRAPEKLALPLFLSLVVMFIMLIMENTEKRIPVQRISIHNIYADKNYLAIKLNPIGVMPAMFSMAFFMLPQLIVTVISWMLPQNAGVLWWQENLNLSKPFGIGVYVVVLYVLTVGFSRVFVNPREVTEQFLKSGDSLQDIHAGNDTKRYLSHTITRIGILSATVMSICLSAPMLLSMAGCLEGAFTALPSSVMMLTGIWCNLYSEIKALKDLDAYRPFI